MSKKTNKTAQEKQLQSMKNHVTDYQRIKSIVNANDHHVKKEVKKSNANKKCYLVYYTDNKDKMKMKYSFAYNKKEVKEHYQSLSYIKTIDDIITYNTYNDMINDNVNDDDIKKEIVVSVRDYKESRTHTSIIKVEEVLNDHGSTDDQKAQAILDFAVNGAYGLIRKIYANYPRDIIENLRHAVFFGMKNINNWRELLNREYSGFYSDDQVERYFSKSLDFWKSYVKETSDNSKIVESNFSADELKLSNELLLEGLDMVQAIACGLWDEYKKSMERGEKDFSMARKYVEKVVNTKITIKEKENPKLYREVETCALKRALACGSAVIWKNKSVRINPRSKEFYTDDILTDDNGNEIDVVRRVQNGTLGASYSDISGASVINVNYYTVEEIETLVNSLGLTVQEKQVLYYRLDDNKYGHKAIATRLNVSETRVKHILDNIGKKASEKGIDLSSVDEKKLKKILGDSFPEKTDFNTPIEEINRSFMYNTYYHVVKDGIVGNICIKSDSMKVTENFINLLGYDHYNRIKFNKPSGALLETVAIF